MIKIACDFKTTVKCTEDARRWLQKFAVCLQQNFAKMLKPRVQAVVTASCFKKTLDSASSIFKPLELIFENIILGIILFVTPRSIVNKIFPHHLGCFQLPKENYCLTIRVSKYEKVRDLTNENIRWDYHTNSEKNICQHQALFLFLLDKLADGPIQHGCFKWKSLYNKQVE